MKLFAKIMIDLKAINYFRKKLHPRYLTQYASASDVNITNFIKSVVTPLVKIFAFFNVGSTFMRNQEIIAWVCFNEDIMMKVQTSLTVCRLNLEISNLCFNDV